MGIVTSKFLKGYSGVKASSQWAGVAVIICLHGTAQTFDMGVCCVHNAFPSGLAELAKTLFSLWMCLYGLAKMPNPFFLLPSPHSSPSAVSLFLLFAFFVLIKLWITNACVRSHSHRGFFWWLVKIIITQIFLICILPFSWWVCSTNYFKSADKSQAHSCCGYIYFPGKSLLCPLILFCFGFYK